MPNEQPTHGSDADQPGASQGLMDRDIATLEAFSGSDVSEIDVDTLVAQFRELHQEQPLWRLVDAIQHQSMVYWNIIERLKAGERAAELRVRFEGLGLVPTDPPLPNPSENRLLKVAKEKLAKYRSALVVLIDKFGVNLIRELSIETGYTVGLAVNMGFPPSVSVSIEYTAVAQTVQERRWVAAKPDAQP